jgi:hypothetical protein
LINHSNKFQAAGGNDLCVVMDLLLALLQLQPRASIRANQLKQAILICVIAEPGLNHSNYKAAIYAGFRAERIITILHHWRRVVREPYRWTQMAGQTTGPNLVLLQAAKDITTLHFPKSKKRLQRQISNDSEGYPTVLRSEATQLT